MSNLRSEKVPLSKDMREATREVHKLSDALVNAKLAFALNNNDVWCDGLLVFYEIFKFLEENVSQQILPSEYYRTQQFESDIEFYKGSDWQKTYKIRASVEAYLNHLFDIKEKNPLLLIAYVYHLYMGNQIYKIEKSFKGCELKLIFIYDRNAGLLSGGQVLAKKRSVGIKFRKTFSGDDEDDNFVQPGSQITSFPNKSILELKNYLRHTIDEFSRDFEEDIRSELIAESKKVFQLNNLVINSVEGVGRQLRKNFESFLIYFMVGSIGLYFLFKFLF